MKIEVVVSSRPDRPEFGYADHLLVTDENGKSIYGSHCSTSPNPYSTKTKEPWNKTGGWIAPFADYTWEYYVSLKYGPCLLVNGGKEVVSRVPNARHDGRKVITEVLIHSGGIGSVNPEWRGSKGCLTLHPDNWPDFIGLFRKGDKGKLEIRDAMPGCV